MSHSEKHSGLQEHSVGEHYPWTVRGLGENSLQPFHCTTGETGPRYYYRPEQVANGAFKTAHRYAEAWIERQQS